MSKFTTELRYIVENESLFPPLDVTLSLKNVLSSYPLYKETYVIDGKTINRRDELNQKIIEHYYFREIGFETVPRFLYALKRKMNEIMQYYNQKYKSVDMDINPINNVDMTETFEHTISGSGKTTSTGTNTNVGTNSTTNNGSNTNTNTNTNENLVVNSDTPNQELSENDIKANKYASTTSYDKSNSTITNSDTAQSTQQSNINNTENLNGEINTNDTKTETFTRKEMGSSKGYTFAQNIQQWRDIMISVDMEIVKDLESLFMNVW